MKKSSMALGSTSALPSYYDPQQTVDIRRTRLPSIKPEIGDYDPRDHRTPPHEIKVWMAHFNLLRATWGAGMLAMPLVISQAGIFLGPIITLATGLLIVHAHRLLLNCLYEIARQLKVPYVSYRYGFRLALLHGPPILHSIANHGPAIIAVFMFASQLGICTVLVIFTTDCLRDLMDWQSSYPAIISLLFPYLIMEFFMKNLTIISYVAMLGSVFNLIGIGFVFEHIISDAHGENMTANTSVTSVLFSMGILLFNLSAVAVVLVIDKSVVNTRALMTKCGVLNLGIICPTIISLIFGCLGYWGFGTMEENILKSLPFQKQTSVTSVSLYLIAMTFTYPLQSYPAIITIVEVIKYHDPVVIPNDETMQWIETLTRPLFVILSFIICWLVPFQGPFVAFVGDLCTSMLALVFPALMDICLRYPHYYGDGNIHLIKDLIIMGIGLASLFFGIFFCGYLIHIRMLSKYSPNNYGFF